MIAEALPWLLLATTLSVRFMLARHNRAGFVVDLFTVPLWTYYYFSAGDYQLVVIPYVFAYLDVKALTAWWEKARV